MKSDPSEFPGFIGSNHCGPNTRGPLKDDWTKACPMEWTTEERDEKCISQQEAIYGTSLLRRLEAVKKKIDPTFMFNCHGCIGNKVSYSKSNNNKGNGKQCEKITTKKSCRR
jgi:hypothetical protein